MPSALTVIRVAVPRPLHSLYDYHVPEGQELPLVGARVRVPFGNSRVVGICVENDVKEGRIETKPILDVIDQEAAIPATLLDLAQWMSQYYHHPLGEVLATILPSAARRGSAFEIKALPIARRWLLKQADFKNPRATRQEALVQWLGTAVTEATDGVPEEAILKAGFTRDVISRLVDLGVLEAAPEIEPAPLQQPLDPTPAQADAIKAVRDSDGFSIFLLEGVTGSGKTEVYLQAMAPALNAGGQILVLVPEIALTPQTLARFEDRFGRTGMIHSGLTDQQRLQTWLRCKSGELTILIGTRSAIFTPFAKLGLIIVDEEHDSSYKQQEGLRYSARDLAAKRAQQEDIPLLLGSATPSLESIFNVQRGRYRHLLLADRAGGASMPSYHIIDLRGQTLHGGLASSLIQTIREHLAASGQVLLYLNRRGYAPTLLCQSCGWQAVCPDCDARLTLHRTPAVMICHHCALRLEVPNHCEACGQGALLPLGQGTQRTEDSLASLFPDVPIHRIDRDTTRTNRQLNAQLQQIHEDQPCIMVGTQMLAKGHHFPSVTLVAVLNADAGLLSPDFRAPERTAQLIVQVAGRAGRAAKPGQVWIQSHQPDNPLLGRLIEDGYAGFAKTELESRSLAGLPPMHPMALLRAEAENQALAQAFLANCKAHLEQVQVAQEGGPEARVKLYGPVPAPMARLANRYRFQLMLIAPSRNTLHRLLQSLGHPRVPAALRWSIDVDPYDAL